MAASSGLPYFSFSDLPRSGHEDVHREGARMAAAFSPDSPIPEAETYAYMGINFMDLVKQYGRDEAERLYKEKGRQAFFRYE